MVWNYFISSLYDEDDSFLIRIRKTMVGVMFFPLSFLGSLYVIYGYFIAETAMNYFHATASLLIGIDFVASYLWMRKTRTVTDTHVAVAFWIPLLVSTVNYLGGPAFDNKSIAVTFFLLNLLVQHPHLPLVVVVLILQTLLIDWNKVMWSNQNYHLLLNPPGYRQNDGAYTQFFGHVWGTVIICATGMMFSRFTKETARKEAAQIAANRLTLEVLRYQRKYDTDSIARLLQEVEQENEKTPAEGNSPDASSAGKGGGGSIGSGNIDPEFIELFKNMNENLLRYKPFLPNYVFQVSEDDDTEGGDISEAEGGNGNGQGSQASSSKVPSGISSSKKYEKKNCRRPHKRRGHHHRHEVTPGDKDDDSSEGEISHTSKNSTPSAASKRSQQPHPSHGAVTSTGTGKNHRGEFFRGKISFAILDISFQSLLCDSSASATGNHNDVGSSGKSPSAFAYTQVVNTVYRLAKETKASVHSMLGDRVQLTWNATHNLALPETKAASFLARIQKRLSLLSHEDGTSKTEEDHRHQGQLQLSGAVCTGPATVHNITSETQQQALIVEAKWTGLLETVLSLATRHRTFLMDEGTRRASSLEIESCPVECLLPPPVATPVVNGAEKSFISTLACPSFLYHQPRTSLTNLQAVSDIIQGAFSNEEQRSDLVAASDGNPQHHHVRVQTSSKPTRGNPIHANVNIIHQILGEKERADDEWMYQLQHDAALNQEEKEGLSSITSCGQLVFGDGNKKKTDQQGKAEIELPLQMKQLLSEVLAATFDQKHGEAISVLKRVEDLRATHGNSTLLTLSEKTPGLLPSEEESSAPKKAATRKGGNTSSSSAAPSYSFFVALGEYCRVN